MLQNGSYTQTGTGYLILTLVVSDLHKYGHLPMYQYATNYAHTYMYVCRIGILIIMWTAAYIILL